MKRFLLAVLFALAFCNVSFAELPVINPIQPTYRDDNSTVLMSSIQPNREFLMMYQIVVDARSFYAVLLKSNLREFTTSSKTISNEARSVELKIPLQLRSNENAEFTIRVSTESGETREHAITLSATDGEPRIMFESPTVEIETGGSEVISIGRRDVDGKYSIYSLKIGRANV